MKEFRITLEDRPGSLAECCVAIGEAGINILGATGLGGSVTAAAIVTEEEEETASALESIGVKYTIKDLHVVVLDDVPGSLGNFTVSLAEMGINLSSIYILKSSEDGVHIGYSTD